MSSSWISVTGLSLAVCLLAALAAPALAAGPAQAHPPFSGSRGTGSAALSGQGIRLLPSALVMGIPLAIPLAAISFAEHAVQRFVSPSHGVNGFTGSITPGMGLRSLNRSAFPPMGQAGVGGIGPAGNLTAYLRGKGYNVTDLNAALTRAGTALRSSNMTEYRSAMMTFRKDLDAKVTAGTINQTVIRDYLKTLSPGTNGPMVRRFPGRGMGIHGRHGWQAGR